MLWFSSDDLLKFGNSSLVVASRDGEDRLTKDLARFIREARTGPYSRTLRASGIKIESMSTVYRRVLTLILARRLFPMPDAPLKSS